MRASAFAVLPLFVFLSSDTEASRKDGGEYWRMAMKDEAMPQAIQGLLHHNPLVESQTNKPQLSHNHDVQGMNHKCDEHEALVTVPDIEAKTTVTATFDDDFKPRPSISSYNNDDLDDQRKGVTDGDLAKDLEPRPGRTSYNNGNLGAQKKKITVDFEPRPSISSYNNGDLGNHEEKFSQDVEPRPSASSYNNGDLSVQKNKLTRDFEPRVSLTSHNNGNLGDQKSIFTENFEPRPNITSYTNGDLGHE